jgi:hypothetical protein
MLKALVSPIRHWILVEHTFPFDFIEEMKPWKILFITLIVRSCGFWSSSAVVF